MPSTIVNRTPSVLGEPTPIAWPQACAPLHLRALRNTDLTAFLGYRSDPRVARYQGWDPMSRTEAETFLTEQAGCTGFVPGAWVQFGIAWLDGDTLIGDVGVRLAADGATAEFGLSLASAAQGHGHGVVVSRAVHALIFEHTPAREVSAYTDQRNLACIRTLERAGMRRVGRREETWKGELCVEFRYRIQRTEPKPRTVPA